jgi:hypothetical protein
MSLECIQQHYHHPFSLEHPLPSVSHHCPPILHNFIIQPSYCWHLMIILLGCCSLGTGLWFRIMYGGNSPSSAHTANVTVTNKFSMPNISITTNFDFMFVTVHFKAYWSTLQFEQHFIFGSVHNCSFWSSNHILLKSNEHLLKICQKSLAKWSSLTKTETFLHIIHITQPILPWADAMWCSAMWKSLSFTFYHLTCNQQKKGCTEPSVPTSLLLFMHHNGLSSIKT